MTEKLQLWAFIATLVALVAVTASAALAAVYNQKDASTALCGIAVGLIGVLRIPASRSGVNVENADQVGPNGPSTGTTK